jgi:hypothetical protein
MKARGPYRIYPGMLSQIRNPPVLIRNSTPSSGISSGRIYQRQLTSVCFYYMLIHFMFHISYNLPVTEKEIENRLVKEVNSIANVLGNSNKFVELDTKAYKRGFSKTSTKLHQAQSHLQRAKTRKRKLFFD